MSALGHAREGARRYGALLSLPGARRPVVFAAVGSMPIGMFGLAILLLAAPTAVLVASPLLDTAAPPGTVTETARSRRAAT